MKIVFLALLSFLLVACDNASGGSVKEDSLHHLVIVSRDGKRHDFKIELALTRQEQAKGLMDRTEMAKDAGMLFFFRQEEERSFWMKNTLIPLDMIFIRKDGAIGKVHDSAKPQDLTSVKSDGPAMAVLELNGGTARKLGIVAGDMVHHAFFGNELR